MGGCGRHVGGPIIGVGGVATEMQIPPPSLHSGCGMPNKEATPWQTGWLDGLGEGGLLEGVEFADALFGEVEQGVEFGAGVGVFFGGGLGFDEAA